MNYDLQSTPIHLIAAAAGSGRAPSGGSGVEGGGEFKLVNAWLCTT